MNMRKLLDLIEAPAAPRQGVTGQKLAQTSGGQFMNRSDRTNQTKVNAALGPGFKAGSAAANQALAKKFSQPATATNVAAPSADNEALKGQTIAKAMNPSAPAANPGTAAAGPAFNQAAGSSPGTATTSTVPTNQSLDPGEEIVSNPANTQTAPYNGAAANAMASRSAAPAPAANPGTAAAGIAFNQAGTPAPAPAANPGTAAAGIAFNQAGTPAPTADTRTSDQIATAQLNTPATPTADTRTSDQIATAQLNTPATPTAEPSNLRPGRQLYGYVSEEDAELNELMRLSGRPVNEKAVSKQQQKFMGMVHAMQKGKKIKGASPELKKVAKTMSKKDAKDFASTKHKSLPSKVSESVMLEAGSALEHIINKFKHETKNFLAGNELDSDLLEALFDYYADNGEMPYGVAKARDGDPHQWIDNKFEQDLSMMGYQRDFNAADLSNDRELTELARLAGLTNEDGPGASRLYTRDKSGMGVVPKDSPKDPGMGVSPKDSLKDTGMGVAPKQTSLKDKMSNEGLSDVTDTVIDTAKGLANKGIDWYNKREQEKKDYWDSIKWADGSGGKSGSSGATADLLPRFQTKADTKLADKKAHDALTGASNAAAAQTAPPTDAKKVKEDAELNQMRRIAGLKEAQPKSPGAAPTHSARERERVVSPKVDKYDKDQEAAEKARRWMIDKESPNANAFGRKIGKAVAEPIAAIKSAWHGATDAWDHEMANDTAPDPKPPVSVVNKRDWKGDRDNPALKECGDMSMDSQQDSMNVSTNMSSDGNKSVNISAQGNKADSLLQILKMAGMRPYDDHEHAGMTKPEVIMIGSNDEEMMDEQYSNTPDEEYQSVDSIIHQGNDLNREKRQYAGKPRLGDNPMAEGVYDPDYRGNYNNEFDELEDLFSKSAMDSSEMNRQRFLANKHGINSPSDMSKLPALRKDAEAGYKTRKSEIDADTERKNQQYMQDKLMDLEYEADPSAFMQRRMQQSSPKDSRASSMDLPKADYSLGGRGAKLPNFNLEPAAPDANDLLDKATDQLDSRLRSRPSMSQQLAQLRNRTRQSRMAESLLDADLDAMLESILIREEDSAAKKVGDAVKNPSNAAKDIGDKVKGRLTTTKGTDGKTSVTSSTGRIRATFDKDKPVKYEPAAPAEPEENEKTNEGVWDTVKDIAGGILGTEDYYLRHDEQLPQLKAMQDQYKGTPYEQQVNDRYQKHLDRLQLDGGPVMTKGPDGRPMVKPVLPPDQFEKGNKR